MAGETILIAAFSGRALAQSARRAGYDPLVVDAFGDLDTRAAAKDFRIVEGAMQTGFRTKPLIAALEALASSASSLPVGLVLGSGLEDKPRLLAALAKRFRLVGSTPETTALCKDPERFFATLDRLGIAHPETRLDPPDNIAGWVTKRVGGSGGRHIRICNPNSRHGRRRYFQKQISGTRVSVGGVFGTQQPKLAMTRQWTTPSSEHPFRFGGAVTLPDPDPALYTELEDATSRAATALGLKGLASFDWIVTGRTPYLLEVNPRPGASLDVLDDAEGTVFRAHMAACLGVQTAVESHTSRNARAMAILHADRGPLTLGATPWPEWSADRGAAGVRIAKGAPLASAFADAASADAAEALARVRLAELEDLIYGHATS